MTSFTWICSWVLCAHIWHTVCGQYSDNTPPIMWVDRSWLISDSEVPGSVITRVRADDNEKDPLEFGLERHPGFNGASRVDKPLPFRIDNDTGVVYLNDTLKELTGRRFLIYVTVTDGKLTAKNEVLVNVFDPTANATSGLANKGLGGGGGVGGVGGVGGSFLSQFPNSQPGGKLPRPPGFIMPPTLPGFRPRPTSATSPRGRTTSDEPDPPQTTPSPTTTAAVTTASPSTSAPKIAEDEPKSNETHVPPDGGAIATMSDLMITIVPIAAVCGLFVVGGIAAWLCRRRMCRQRQKKNKDDMRKESSGGIVLEDPIAMHQWRGPRAQSNRYEGWEVDQQFQNAIAPAKPHGDHWEFPRHRLKVFNILGEGCFGQVWRCEAVDIDGREGTSVVAVKTLKENATERERTDLVQELQVMKMLEPHPNVVRLLGCCSDKEPMFVIMEYIALGKLQSFLRNSRAERHYGNLHGPSKTLTSRDLTSFVYQVARGMEFLSNKGIIHRDLAARNILVDEDHICKVADFGFARDVITSHVYERKSEGRLPIRWMAPESLYDNIFSVKSDVWSFGVLIWEIVTLGSTPYPGLAATDVMKKVRDGYRLDKPEHCRRELYNIMYYCWDKDPKERPSFDELTSMLEQLLLTETEYIELERFPDHSYYNMVSLSGEKL